MTKQVSYKDYIEALEELRSNYPCGSGIKFYRIQESFSDSEPVKMGVSWAAIGTVSAEEARQYAEQLLKAAELADNFKYNGYVIVH